MNDKLKVVPMPKKKEPSSASADDVLEAAKGSLSNDMLIIGWNKEQDAIHILTPCLDKASLVYLLEYVKHFVIAGDLN
jgi:hypothetical protein